jgi:hypothetical protein
VPRLLLLLTIGWLVAPLTGARGAEPPMVEGLATITELNFFTNFNTSAYSLTIGTLDIRADRQGPPCPETAAGQQVAARYNNKVILLGPEKNRCKLTVRRMEFTGAPGPR